MSKVVIYGALPPTLGGISVHVQRLAMLAVSQGFTVTVVDLYSEKPDPIGGVHVVSGRGLIGRVRSLLFACDRSNVSHFHISACGNLLSLAMLLSLASMRSSVVLTIHSGSFPSAVAGLGKFKKMLVSFIFRRVSRVIAVSDSISQAVVDLGVSRDGVVVIPAFIPVPLLKSDIESVRFNLDESRINILASGYGTKLYDWDTLVRAFKKLSDNYALHLAFYNTIDEQYFRDLLDLIGGDEKIFKYQNLSPLSFSSLMQQCQIFVRPTLTDGDSIAVREALAGGMVVVASDSVGRPEGCVIFKTGSVDSLVDALGRTGNSEVGVLRQQVGDALVLGRSAEVFNSGLRVLGVYRDVLGRD